MYVIATATARSSAKFDVGRSLTLSLDSQEITDVSDDRQRRTSTSRGAVCLLAFATDRRRDILCTSIQVASAEQCND